MNRLQKFAMPDVGEGLTEAEVLEWKVAVGDRVEVNQIIVEIETAKAAVELPCPYAGTVHALLVEPGITVDVGTPIIVVDTQPDAGPLESPLPVSGQLPTAGGTGGTDGRPVPTGSPDPDGAEPVGAKIGETAADGRVATLVGYIPAAGSSARRPRKTTGHGATPAPAPIREAFGAAFTGYQVASPPAPVPAPDDTETPVSTAAQTATTVVDGSRARSGAAPLAAPQVRKLAKDRGIDLAAVVPIRPDGVITRADLDGLGRDAGAPEPAVPGPTPVAPGAEYDPATRERRVPIKGVRKMTAAAMVASAFTAPHVTEFLTVDVTPMMDLRDRLRRRPEFADVKVTPLAFAARAVCLAARRTPEINSVWDEAAQEIVFKQYLHLGIAAATPRGLIVPNIRDAERLDLRGLATAITALTETARAGRTTPAEMTGGTFTITNVGVFGVDTGTPIINPGESAILALGSIRDAPWVVDGQLAVRKVCQLALSFDHRVVDGAQGSMFLADVGALLADPGLALAY